MLIMGLPSEAIAIEISCLFPDGTRVSIESCVEQSAIVQCTKWIAGVNEFAL